MFRGGEREEATVECQPVMVVPEPSVMLVVLVGGGELVRVLPMLEPESVDVHALYPSHRSLSAKVRVFIDALVIHLKARPASRISA